MKNTHISESDLQEFILSKGDSTNISAHLKQCELCQAKANAYRSIFQSIERLPSPEFDFDLSQLVVTRIEKSTFKLSAPMIFLPVLASVLLIAMLIYIFNQDTISLAIGLQKMALYLLLATGVVFLVFQAIEIYKVYIKKIQTLNFLN